MPDQAGAGRPGTGALAGGMVELDRAECLAILASQRLGVLALTDGTAPYAVPLFYGFDGETVFLGTSEGRKTALIDANPRVCMSVAETGPGDAWRSVLVSGRATVVSDPAERERGIQVLMAHNRRPDRPQPSPAEDGTAPRRRHSGGRILRIDDAEITGRAKR